MGQPFPNSQVWDSERSTGKWDLLLPIFPESIRWWWWWTMVLVVWICGGPFLFTVLKLSCFYWIFQDILSRPEFLHDCEEFCLSHPADVIIIMTLWKDDTSLSHRRIAVFSLNRIYREQVWFSVQVKFSLLKKKKKIVMQPSACSFCRENIEFRSVSFVTL